MKAEAQRNGIGSEFWRVTLHFASWVIIVPYLATSLWLAWSGTCLSHDSVAGFLRNVLVMFCMPIFGLYGSMVNALVTIPGAFLTFSLAWRLKTPRSRRFLMYCGLAGGASWAAFINRAMDSAMDAASLIVIGSLAGFVLAGLSIALLGDRESESPKP